MKSQSYPAVLLGIVLLFLTQAAQSQTHTARYISMTPNTNAFYEYLPQGYSSTSTETHPLIVFVHGIGERGTGTASSLPLVLRHAIPRVIKQGLFPASVTINGKTHRFIVISPQFINWPSTGDIDKVISYAIANYKVDPSRIYLAGLSMGGGVIWNYGGSTTYSSRVAAIAPFAGAAAPSVTRAQVIAANQVAVWGFHNRHDGDAPLYYTVNQVNYINAASPAPAIPARISVYEAYGHDSWTRACTPINRENGYNLYEWFLLHARGTLPVYSKAPVVNVGTTRTITLPTNSVQLSGAASDSDGTIVSYAWSQVMSTATPSTATFSNKTITNPTVSNLLQGMYTFRLTATDNAGASTSATVNVIVKSTITVNAGPAQTITLPTNSVQLAGSATDADGTIVSYAWTQTAGPSTATFSDKTITNPTVSGLLQGTYTFRLTATDNSGATSFASVNITVNALTNKAPVVNAGTAQTITLPLNSVKLTGSATDADGTIASYAWTQTAGPSAATFSSKTIAAPTVSGLLQGTYTFRLTATDNGGASGSASINITVKAANTAPVVGAGADQSITLPTNSMQLAGTATDADGTIASYAWTQTAGPSAATFSSKTIAAPTVSGLLQGTYTFRLTATDNGGATASDSVSITVNPAANTAPVVSAGVDQSITLPANSTQLAGTATDADGTISSYTWTQTAGPSTATFSSTTVPAPTVSGLLQGTYTFRLTATDNGGASGSASVTITVKAAINTPPIVNAGVDQNITLPVDSTQLGGSATDADGTIVSYAWTQIAGPSTATFSKPTIAAPIVSNLEQGTYTFTLTVTDDDGATASASVDVTVNAARVEVMIKEVRVNVFGGTNPYTANGWNNWNTSNLNSGTLPFADGTASGISATLSSQTAVSDNSAFYLSGLTNTMAPLGVLRHASHAAVTRTLTISGLDDEKTYDLELFASRNGETNNTTRFTINGIIQDIKTDNNANNKGFFTGLVPTNGQIVVSISKLKDFNYLNGFILTENEPPLVNAGVDQNITLPVDSTQLAGTATDADGTISSYTWAQTAGPSTATFSSTTVPAPTVSNLEQGTYTFTLTVTDDDGATASASVDVTVNAAIVEVTTKQVKVNIFGGVNPYNQDGWNNWNVTGTMGFNITSGNFTYSDGAASTVNAVLSASQGVIDNGASYGGTMCPPEVLRYLSHWSGTRTLTLRGLNNNLKYDLEFYNSRAHTGQTTVIVINGVSQSVATDLNKANKVVFTDLVPSNGQLVITLSKTSSFNYLNGFTLTETTTSNTAPVVKRANQPAIEISPAGGNVFAVFPNPVEDRFMLQVNNRHVGQMKVQVIDMNGVSVKEFVLSKNIAGAMQSYLSIGNLRAGSYIVRAQIGQWSDTKKIIKL